MKVDIWSDVYCPWCYLGKRRLENAITQFEHGDQVEITWHSFQLDPNAANESKLTTNEMLAKKMGRSIREVEVMQERLTGLAAEEGLEYHLDKAIPGNSFNAHRLIHLAATYNLQGEMKERLMKAYFTETLSVSDPEVLVRLGVEVGLDEADIRDMLNSDAYANDVNADIRDAMTIGINGVPFFVFNDKYAVSGAQQTEVFLGALNRTWQDFFAPMQVIAGPNTATPDCNDESCAI